MIDHLIVEIRDVGEDSVQVALIGSSIAVDVATGGQAHDLKPGDRFRVTLEQLPPESAGVTVLVPRGQR